MEPYYSSEEEIAWGPITLREIKSDLKKRTVRKPNRRHTVLCQIKNTAMDESLSKDINNLNISSKTAYYTPNESLKASNNSDFLEKLTHVINVPSSDFSIETRTSEYASVLEHTENSNIQSEEMKSLAIPQIFISKADEHAQDDTYLNFIKDSKHRKTQFDIENIEQSLVENSYIISEAQITTEEDNALTDEHSVLEEKEEVIILSDESDSFTEYYEDVSYDEKIISFKKEVSFESHENEFLEKCSEISDEAEHKYEQHEYNADSEMKNQQFSIKISTTNVHDQIEDFLHTPDMQRKLSTMKETSNSNIHEPIDDFLLTPNMKQQNSFIKETLTTSPVIIPEIDLTQFDDSVKDDSLQLNDTLEEMNRLLHQGLNYSMSDDEVIENTPIKKDLGPQNFTPSQDIVSSKQLFSDSKDKISHIPKRIYLPTSTEKKIKTSTNTNFKIPELPSRPKLTNPTPPKSSLRLKNIVSPVALYINNSPRIPLKQNVPLRELTRIEPTARLQLENKENFPEFPEVVYKPSSKQIVSTEKHIIVPPYLRKLNMKEGHITKHEGRINQELNRNKISEKLLQSDITRTTIDHSLLDNTGDISVLTNKQAFIK